MATHLTMFGMVDVAEKNGRKQLKRAKRIVVKVGSALLAKGGSRLFAQLASQLAQLKKANREVVLVSSGAIALGFPLLGFTKRPQEVSDLQAAAAAGQPELMQRWARALARYRITTAQVLLTHADLADRERYLNARHSFHSLLTRHSLPIVNENDVVATDEIKVGDNDQLSAHVASLIDADILILLTSVDGVYDANPEIVTDAQRIACITDPNVVMSVAGGAGQSGLGTGGMRTKVLAAVTATARNISVIIADGAKGKVLLDVMAGKDVGTLFLPQQSVPSRKHWIVYTLRPKGTLYVDAGAMVALKTRGRSLLAKGVVRVEGGFERGAMVEIAADGGVFSRGLVAYSSAELQRIVGRKSNEIATVLGYVGAPEVVHRDDLVLLS